MNELELQKELTILRSKVAEFEKWKAERELQQISFPLDYASREIVQENFIVATGNVVIPVGLLSANTALEIKVNDQFYWILVSPSP